MRTQSRTPDRVSPRGRPVPDLPDRATARSRPLTHRSDRTDRYDPAGRRAERAGASSSLVARPEALVPPRVRRRARALLWRHRFVVAALLVGLAAAVVVHRLAPPPEPRQAVVVAASTLPAGTTLGAADLRTVDLPLDVVAEGWHSDRSAVVGRTLALDVPEGTILGAPLLVDEAATGPPGTVVAGVRLAEPALVAVLSPGMHVDLLAAAPTLDGAEGASAVPATTLATRALVLPQPASAADGGEGILGSAGSAGDAAELVLVAVTPDEASLLANVAGRQAVSAVVVR